jgi:cytochrome c peroxidase
MTRNLGFTPYVDSSVVGSPVAIATLVCASLLGGCRKPYFGHIMGGAGGEAGALSSSGGDGGSSSDGGSTGEAGSSSDGGSTGEAGAAGAGNTAGEGTPYPWDLPVGFPQPSEPTDNRTTVEKVELGRHLFYDVRLSANNTASCASCHRQELAFTDGRQVGVGSTGEHTPRNSMTLANVGYATTLTWANPLLLTLERQAIVPMFGEMPVELGIHDAADLEAELQEIPRYRELFREAYPGAEELATVEQVTRALAAFQRTLVSSNAPYDRWVRGEDPDALSAAALRGYKLFNSEKLECFHCHVGFNLSDQVTWQDKPFFDAPFHNTGLYNIDGKGAYPEPNSGVFSVTGDASDMGRFKAPTLRNIAITAPYMHDGSIETLDGVLDHYAAGGREIIDGPNAGKGSANPLKDVLIRGFELSLDERRDVIEFLNSFTDTEFLTDPRLSDPWVE